MAQSVENAISQIASEERVNRNALERLIYNESRGNPYVGMNNSNYSAGISQISRVVWKKYSNLPYAEASKPKYWKQNMRIGAKYLKENYQRFGNWKDALSAYNMGATALQKVKLGQRNMPIIAQNYIKNFKE